MTKQTTNGEIGDLTHNLPDATMKPLNTQQFQRPIGYSIDIKSLPVNLGYYDMQAAVKAYIADLIIMLICMMITTMLVKQFIYGLSENAKA